MKRRNTQLLWTIAAALAAGALTVMLLWGMLRWSGNPAHRASNTAGSQSVSKKYDRFMTNQVSDALDGILSVEKVYWIEEDELTAPKPNPDCFGETDDPTTLGWLLEKAQTILDGQEFYFNTDIQLFPGSKVRYYLDDTIFAVTWKELRDYGAYTFSEVKIAHPSQFRRFLANGEYGSDKLFITTEMAQSVNAVVASSGDFYRFRHAGVLVYDGTVQRINNGLVDTCYITQDGDMLFTGTYDYLTMEKAQEFVDENNIRFSLAFGPILIRDGKVCTPSRYTVGEINDEYSRAALCQMGKLHYLLATVNMEGRGNYVPDIHRFARSIQKTGCINAYALDGGQTAVIVHNNELINNVMYGYQRKISDIIYFATAIPSGE